MVTPWIWNFFQSGHFCIFLGMERSGVGCYNKFTHEPGFMPEYISRFVNRREQTVNKTFLGGLKRMIAMMLCLFMVMALMLPLAAQAQETGKTVRVGWYESPFNTTDQFGRRSGYAYDYQQKIAAYTGWNYEYVEGSWPELMQMLIDGEIDLMSDVSYTDERAEIMLFSSLPMGAEEYYIYISPDNEEINKDDLSTFNGKKVGVYKGSVQMGFFREWAEKNSVQAELIEMTEGVDESLDMLKKGDIDMYVVLDGYLDSRFATPICKVGASDFFFAVSKSRPDLLAELNAAMNRIQDENRNYHQQLYEKYLKAFGFNYYLNKEENDWLSGHGTIRVGYRDGYLPFCDTDPKTGELTGALSDYLELAARSILNAKIEFKAIPYPTVNAALDALKAGEIDCVFPVFLSIGDGEELGVSVTSGIMDTEMYAAVRKEDHISTLSEREMTVAIHEGEINYETFLKEYFPNWKIVYCGNTEKGCRAVADGTADCMLFSNYRLTQTEGLRKKYKLAVLATGKRMNFGFAIGRNEWELYHILNKTVDVVPSSTIESALFANSWPEVRFSLLEFLEENLTAVILVIVVIAVIIVLLLIRRSNRMKRQYEEKLKLQDALSTALAEAEEANRAKTWFLSNMSHEIRTPMNAIIGLDTLALHDDSISPTTRGYLEKIGSSAHHLLDLINDILDMSRIESGRIELRKEEFSFRTMLEQINMMVMSQCSDKGLTYECRLLSQVDDYYIGDDVKLKEVLINILSNAVKFTEAPGSITMTVERTVVFEDQSTLRFSIKDTGIGMDKDYIPKIFDPFSQENSTTKSKYGSTGLGMAITKRIVEMMNGTISVESEKGVGSTFTVVVTLRNTDCQVRNTEDSIDPGRMHVLVVDDDKIAAEHAEKVLGDVGIRADVCHSGAEALRMLEVQHTKHEPYNLVLMDWKMPEMDGLEAAAEIRKLYNNETTVVIITAYDWADIEEEAHRIGVDSFLSKPLFASNVIEEFARIAMRNNMSLFKEKKKASLKGRKILIAEDQKMNAEILMDLLELEDVEADHAENGLIVVEMFRSSDIDYYDAILMDIRMPEMDGLEATEAIRKLERPDAKRIPIIALTANAFDEDVQRSLQAGMNAHLTKPVDPDHLYQTLGELIYEAEEKTEIEKPGQEQ